LSAVAFREGDAWIVQGIEHDICAHAQDLSDLPAVFMRAIAETVVIAQHLGRQGLEGVKPAPDRFRKMFDLAQTRVLPINVDSLPDWPMQGIDIRLAPAELPAS